MPALNISAITSIIAEPQMPFALILPSICVCQSALPITVVLRFLGERFDQHLLDCARRSTHAELDLSAFDMPGLLHRRSSHTLSLLPGQEFPRIAADITL